MLLKNNFIKKILHKILRYYYIILIIICIISFVLASKYMYENIYITMYSPEDIMLLVNTQIKNDDIQTGRFNQVIDRIEQKKIKYVYKNYNNIFK